MFPVKNSRNSIAIKSKNSNSSWAAAKPTPLSARTQSRPNQNKNYQCSTWNGTKQSRKINRNIWRILKIRWSWSKDGRTNLYKQAIGEVKYCTLSLRRCRCIISTLIEFVRGRGNLRVPKRRKELSGLRVAWLAVEARKQLEQREKRLNLTKNNNSWIPRAQKDHVQN